MNMVVNNGNGKKVMFAGKMKNKRGVEHIIKLYETDEFTDIGHLFVNGEDTHILVSIDDAAEYVRRYCL